MSGDVTWTASNRSEAVAQPDVSEKGGKTQSFPYPTLFVASDPTFQVLVEHIMPTDPIFTCLDPQKVDVYDVVFSTKVEHRAYLYSNISFPPTQWMTYGDPACTYILLRDDYWQKVMAGVRTAMAHMEKEVTMGVYSPPGSHEYAGSRTPDHHVFIPAFWRMEWAHAKPVGQFKGTIKFIAFEYKQGDEIKVDVGVSKLVPDD